MNVLRNVSQNVTTKLSVAGIVILLLKLFLLLFVFVSLPVVSLNFVVCRLFWLVLIIVFLLLFVLVCCLLFIMNFTFDEYADMYLVLGESRGNFAGAARLYAERYPQRRHPTRNVIQRMDQRFRETGSIIVRNIDRGRPRTIRTPALEEQVLQQVEEEPRSSTRGIGQNLGATHTTVHQILADDGLYPFHLTKVQGLFPNDYYNRITYCEWLLEKQEADEDFVRYILWTDEATFTRDGIFNIHNSHQWGNQNPYAKIERNHQVRFSLNVWAGIFGDAVIGPLMLPNRINANDFLLFLTTDLPELLEDVPLAARARMWLQCDGAPPHYGIQVRRWLDQQFPQRWIGRGGPTAWPARSPDLTPLDFFLWGYIKEKVYATPVSTLAELEGRIMEAFATITPEMLQNVLRNISERAQACHMEGGGHFEHLG